MYFYFMSKMPSYEGFPDKFTKEQIDERYDLVARQKQNYRVTRALSYLLRGAVRPNVSYQNREKVEVAVKSKNPIALVANHQYLLDPFVTVAAVTKEKSLADIQQSRRSARREGRAEPKHTWPMAKVDLYRESDKVGRFARLLLKKVAGIPIVREGKDCEDEDKGYYSRRQGMRVVKQNLLQSINSLSFPQGTREESRFDPEATKHGIASIAVAAAVEMSRAYPETELNPEGVWIMPFAISYPQRSTLAILNPFKRGADLHFAEPMFISADDTVPDSSMRQFVDQTHHEAMGRIDEAVEFLEVA